MNDTKQPTPQEFHEGAKQAINDLYTVFNGIIECSQCKGRSKRSVPCRDLRGHYNMHFFHITNFLKAVEAKAAKDASGPNRETPTPRVAMSPANESPRCRASGRLAARGSARK